MMFKKEEYLFFYDNKEKAYIFIYNILLKLKLIKNLKNKYIEDSDIKILYSFNSKMVLKVFIYNKSRIILFIIKCKNNFFIKKIRKYVITKKYKTKLIYSDFLIEENIIFFNKFIRYENFLRKNILKTMYFKYNKDWWFKNIDSKISHICKKRASHDNYNFDYIFYSNFIDIKDIILNNWEDLSFLLKNNKNNIKKLEIINNKRNKIFHGRFDFI